MVRMTTSDSLEAATDSPKGNKIEGNKKAKKLTSSELRKKKKVSSIEMVVCPTFRTDTYCRTEWLAESAEKRSSPTRTSKSLVQSNHDLYDLHFFFIDCIRSAAFLENRLSRLCSVSATLMIMPRILTWAFGCYQKSRIVSSCQCVQRLSIA